MRLNYIALVEGQGYFFGGIMVDLKKVYNSIKIALLITSISLLFTSPANPYSSRDLLRNPVGKKDTYDRMKGAVRLTAEDYDALKQVFGEDFMRKHGEYLKGLIKETEVEYVNSDRVLKRLNYASFVYQGLILLKEIILKNPEKNLERIGDGLVQFVKDASSSPPASLEVRRIFKKGLPELKKEFGIDFIDEHWEELLKISNATKPEAGRVFLYLPALKEIILDEGGDPEKTGENLEEMTEGLALIAKLGDYGLLSLKQYKCNIYRVVKVLGIDFIKTNWKDFSEISILGLGYRRLLFYGDSLIFLKKKGLIDTYWQYVVKLAKEGDEEVLNFLMDPRPYTVDFSMLSSIKEEEKGPEIISSPKETKRPGTFMSRLRDFLRTSPSEESISVVEEIKETPMKKRLKKEIELEERRFENLKRFVKVLLAEKKRDDEAAIPRLSEEEIQGIMLPLAGVSIQELEDILLEIAIYGKGSQAIIDRAIDLSTIESTPVLFEDLEVILNPEGFKDALSRLEINNNIPIILLTAHTDQEYQKYRKAIEKELRGKGVDLENVQFKTPKELGLEGLEWRVDERPISIEGIDDLKCLPLTNQLGEIFKDLKKARDQI